MERLGEHDEIELSTCRLPVLEGGPLDADTLCGRHPGHPLVRLHGKHIGAGLRQLRCRDTCSRADVKRPQSASGDQTRDEWAWVARPVAVVLLGRATERL